MQSKKARSIHPSMVMPMPMPCFFFGTAVKRSSARRVPIQLLLE
jgi:hypothetical protein